MDIDKPKPTRKDPKAFVRAMKEGKTLKDSMLAAGYAENSAKQGRAALSAEMVGALLREGIKLGLAVTPQEQEQLVRGKLIQNALEGNDKAVQSLKLLGQDRRVNMFTAESQTGIIVVQTPVQPNQPDTLQLEDKPKTLLGE